jgi:hypothetical protein
LVLRHQAIRVVEAKPADDPFELLPGRVGCGEMTLHVPEHARHLTEDVAGRHKVEELSLGSIEVALGPLDKRPVPEDPADHDQAPIRAQRILGRRLPGRCKVSTNGVD